MKWFCFTFLVLLVIPFTPETKALGGAAPGGGGPRRCRTFLLSEGQRRVETGISFMVPRSDSVAMDGAFLKRGKDYRINNLRGTIALVSPAGAGQLLKVCYSRFPFTFQPLFARRYPGGEVPSAGRRFSDSLLAPPARSKKNLSPYRLKVSGSKSVGFSVGSSRGLGIDQSMNVTLAGKLAEDLEVKAFLSDDNLPVQPEGNTEELKRLDRISVNIKSRHSQVRLADFESGVDWSDFSSYSRQLRGGEAAVNLDGQRYFAGGGIAKGRFETVEMMGREGIQGPYELLSALRFNGAIIIPGSEKVYLDGEVMRRGSENDYVIDYTRAAVTFTERVPITDDSEIVVEFQAGERGYQRSTLAGGWSAPFYSGVLNLRTLFFRESDDRDSPVGGEYTEEELSVLRNAGDDSDRAFASGIQRIEDDGGSGYVPAEGDSSVPDHYRFVESGAQFILDFYPSPGGDYDTDGFSSRGTLKYKYVGAGKGSYRIGRPLPLPERKNIFVASVEGESEHLFFDLEADASDHDRNTLSGLDDDNNTGYALNLEGGVKGLRISSSRLRISGEYSSLEAEFAAPDRAREAYFYRNWNLEDVPLAGREVLSGAKIDWRREGLWKLSGGYRRLSREGGLSAGMGDAQAALGSMDHRGLRAEWLKTETGDNRKRDFALAEGAMAFWKVLPKISFDTERYSSFAAAASDTGRYYYRNLFSLATRETGNFSSSISYSRRVTDNLRDEGGEWFKARENDEVRFSGSYSGGSALLDLFVSHRVGKEFEYGLTSKHDLARLRFRDSWEDAGVTTDIGYRISSGEERKRQRAVIYVGENEGDYDEEGREVGQRRGDYMVVYIPGGQKEDVRNVELTWRLSFGNGIRGLGFDREKGKGFFRVIKRNVSLDQFFSVSEKSTTDELFRLYRLDPSLLQRDDVTLFGRNSLRQEWNFLKNVKKYNLRFVFSREDEEDNRSEGASASRYRRELRVRAEALSSSIFNISAEAAGEDRESRSENPTAQNYDVSTFLFSGSLGYRPRPGARYSFEMAYEKRKDELSVSRQNSFSGKPAANISLGTDINLAAFFKLTYTSVEVDGGQPLFFLQEGVRQDWNLNGNYRLGRNISLGINYNGRREKDYREEVKTVHALKVESRAYF